MIEIGPPAAPRRRGARARWAALFSAVAVLALIAGVLAIVHAVSADATGDGHSGTSGGVAAGAPGDVPLPADCTPTSNPPPTEYGLVVTITQGSATGPTFAIDGLTPRICGIIRIVSGTGSCKAQGKVIIPSDGMIFPSDLAATLTVVPGMHPKIPASAHAHPIGTLLPCTGSSANGLKLDLPITVDGSIGAFGLNCSITLSGTAHSVITGDLFSGDYKGDITLTGADFHAAPVSNHDKYCPGTLPGHVNTIAQLPDDSVSMSLSGKVAVYQH